jgi:hypothetical protein
VRHGTNGAACGVCSRELRKARFERASSAGHSGARSRGGATAPEPVTSDTGIISILGSRFRHSSGARSRLIDGPAGVRSTSLTSSSSPPLAGAVCPRCLRSCRQRSARATRTTS